MLRLAAAGWEAVLLPEQGAAFASLTHAGRDILVPVAPGRDPNAGDHGAFLMAPWTNRLDGGRITVAGREWRMPINRPDEGTSLHGLVRLRRWAVEAEAPDRAVLSCTLDHPPFRCALRMEVALSAEGLFLSLALANTGDGPTPMGMGWHPFFPRPRGTRLRFAAATVFGRDARTLPVAPRPTAGIAAATRCSRTSTPTSPAGTARRRSPGPTARASRCGPRARGARTSRSSRRRSAASSASSR
jgi:aldose 1-epimerase